MEHKDQPDHTNSEMNKAAETPVDQEAGGDEDSTTNLQEILIAAYILIGLAYTVYCWQWGDTAHKSFFYNLGRGIVWPLSMLQ